jgi:MFS family permease
MLGAIAAVVAGSALILAALGAASVGLLFAGTAVTGFGFGAGFQGGIRTVIPLAEPHERAGVLSLLFVISYLGMGVPGIAAGYGAAHGLGLIGASRDYAIALIVLALMALAGLHRTRPRRLLS